MRIVGRRRACLPVRLVVLAFLSASFLISRGVAQQLDKPLQNIDEDITAFAWAPDGRLVYAINRPFKTKQYDLEHDDVWIQEVSGKRRRIFAGDKFSKDTAQFTYSVHSFRWSSNAKLIAADLFATTIDDTGKSQDSGMTLLLEDGGKEIRANAKDNVIRDATNASWLVDNSTVVFLTEVVKPKVLYSFKYLNIAGGPVGPVFEGRTFLDFVPVPRSNVAYAIERDRSLAGPPRLQRLDLLSQDDREIATLDSYEGGLSISPSGNKLAYYIDKAVLEVRDLTSPENFVRVRIGLGVFHWSPDETRILLKRSVEKKSGDLVWVDLPAFPAPGTTEKEVPIAQPTPIPVLHGLTFRDFAISPDGKFLGVIAPGKRNLEIFALPSS
jgi:dipeptidyl aminopeptidase/acylaminoacyl peptidase